MRKTLAASAVLLAIAAGWAVASGTTRSPRPLNVVLFIMDDTR